jgi:hypothetical protein
MLGLKVAWRNAEDASGRQSLISQDSIDSLPGQKSPAACQREPGKRDQDDELSTCAEGLLQPLHRAKRRFLASNRQLDF